MSAPATTPRLLVITGAAGRIGTFYRRHLRDTGDNAYRETVRYLRKMKGILERLGRSKEWAAYESSIREQYKRRRNFIELLDRMDRDRIIGGKKK